MEKRYHIVGKESSEKLGKYLARNGQVLLPMVELIEQSRMAVDELIDVLGRAQIEAVLRLSAEREAFSKDLNKVFYAPHEAAARSAFFALQDRWGRMFPSAVETIEKDLDSLLTFFQFDATYWTILRTTNPIERLNKEFKRRTRAMEVTGGEISTYRCLVYVAQTMEYRWSFHPLSQWSTVYTQIAA